MLGQSGDWFSKLVIYTLHISVMVQTEITEQILHSEFFKWETSLIQFSSVIVEEYL